MLGHYLVIVAIIFECADAVCGIEIFAQPDDEQLEAWEVKTSSSEKPPKRKHSLTQKKNLEEYDDPNKKNELEFEPMMTLTNKEKEKRTVVKNLNCEDFSQFALNCTMEAALIYNSSRKTPPLPSKIIRWCKAIRYMTNCALDWNTDCKDVTESHFNEESIRGHMHVVSNVCDDEWFLRKYSILPRCIEGAQDYWENCYTTFKQLVDDQKNTSHEWTHFATHFYMCCARARFRRCTLDALFAMPGHCTYEQAVTLQKFSVIVSKGDVFQDCDHNMMYSNCPGGDPRPSGRSLKKLKTIATNATTQKTSALASHIYCFFFLRDKCFILLFWVELTYLSNRTL